MVSPDGASDCQVPFAISTDTGTERQHNEDACGSYCEGPTHLVLAVADGVSGEEGGEIASRTAVDVTLRAYRESPPEWGPGKRIYRAAQQANIEIHDRAMVVPELRRMSTTLTAIVIDAGMLYAAHVGDSRLYLIRDGSISQKTKDHTVAGDRRRMGLLSARAAQEHPERSILTRSLGRELIAALDRISLPLVRGDLLLVCTDGLYNVLADDELREAASGKDVAAACASLLELANARGTYDNLTAGVVHAIEGASEKRSRWRESIGRILGS